MTREGGENVLKYFFLEKREVVSEEVSQCATIAVEHQLVSSNKKIWNFHNFHNRSAKNKRFQYLEREYSGRYNS